MAMWLCILWRHCVFPPRVCWVFLSKTSSLRCGKMGGRVYLRVEIQEALIFELVKENNENLRSEFK